MPNAQTFQRLFRLLTLASAVRRQNVTPNRIWRSGTPPATCTIGMGASRAPLAWILIEPGLDSHRERAMEQLRRTDRNHKGVKA
jgi:hypothetical protein